MVKIKGLQHIGILVPDVDAAAGWYTGNPVSVKRLSSWRQEAV